MNVEKIRIVKRGKRYKRVVIPDGYERCSRPVADFVTWGFRRAWSSFLANESFESSDRPIYIRRKTQP